jgi:choline dehydrogenase-like flavoprotein
VLGGGTSVYGAALLRPAPSDFEPGRHYGERIPREIREWPLDYSELAPWYDEAESLFDVHHAPDDDFAPLAPPARRAPDDGLLPLAPINAQVVEASRARGLRPFRLPLGIRTATCLRCDRCAGFVCPNGSRRSSARLVEETRAEGHPLALRTRTEVVRVERDGRREVAGLRVRDRTDGRIETIRARRYVLAAGAIGSAALLLQSGFESPHLGRNFMLHESPLAVGVFARPTGADEQFVKQLGFADFYLGTPDLPEKMGLVQSLPAPGEEMLARQGLHRVPRPVRRSLRRRLLPLVGIVEDLPDPRNRVVLGSDGGIRLEHRFSEYDLARSRALARRMREILRAAGALFVSCRRLPAKEHVAHQCGTLRFGRDPRHAVVDRDCRMFDAPNLFVADGGVLPTSLGVGPSLTIVANALRVARIVASEV